ncbi:MAG: DUF1217 domain-containing protein [Hyphomicrobiaceae bacterium]|nr:MAG: DUF1217 domain-containing protein [Hyphomicrobiaceae bacterium]
MVSTVVSYGIVSGNLERSLSATAKKPLVARETEYYLENIRNIKSIDDFIGNNRIFAYAMKAFGLEEMTYAKAFIRKVLTEGVDSSESFANTLTDSRYKEFAEAFNFARYGSATTAFDRTQQGTVDRYVRQALEEDVGEDNEGVRLALYFERKADSLVSAYGILADAALLKVAQTALGLPAATSALDIEKQAALIDARLDIADLKDPEKLKTFLTRFASLWEIDNPSTVQSSSAVLFAQPIELGIGQDLLASLQNLKRGG